MKRQGSGLCNIAARGGGSIGFERDLFGYCGVRC